MKLFIILATFAVALAQERLVVREPRCPTNEDPFNPTHLAHPSDCTKFYKCETGRAYEFTCPRGHHWNSRMGYCDFPDLANCQLGQTSGGAPTRPGIGAPTRPAPTRPGPNTQFPTWPTGLPTASIPAWWTPSRPAPSVWTTASTPSPWWTTTRPAPTAWPTWPTATRPATQWPTTPNQWWTQTQSQNVWTTPNPNLVQQMICPAQDTPGHNIFFGNPFDCGTYYQCNSGRAVLYRCQSGLHWSRMRNCCDFPQNARCILAAIPLNNEKEAEKVEE